MSGKQEIGDKGSSNNHMGRLNRDMQNFWRERQAEMLEGSSDEGGQRAMPFARIKKIMKSDEQVKMIRNDTLVVFAKACETLIMELTARAWMQTEDNGRETLQRTDIANAIKYDRALSRLNNTLPLEEADQSFFSKLLDEEMQGNYSPMPSPPSTPVIEDDDDAYTIYKKFFPDG